MTVYEKKITFKTGGEVEMVDLTGRITSSVEESGVREGIGLVFVPGATGAIVAIEYEEGLLEDFPRALERLVPRGIEYKHHLKWHDDNGHSHVRASILGPDLSFPISGGRPVLGTWQQIVFVELDTRPRERKIIVKIIGE
ncbi:secondary thiamine-phosphate synthase enzyme [Thermoplasmatales archaeon ex4484_36]|nr:MAG: secondary thiamine-phosphate synthase enzyme [Thermoplasmatales archaeon ex4484_36]RLF54462.1 MAG: YjbQ family protein [Thermoplasmata archaeon]HDD59982.1 YjbQ family protein [Euryarchaeota archaeon]RLF70823.1 MAG: YjbQ family protein [Thermoplasmata archaeon]RLF72197.1 MAG: YjbQ family protein [Thermoplasmata archaeon]